MNDALVHRGPDSEGIKMFASDGLAVALGHRRLSIIDLAGGKQPMSNEDASVWITYNGEIYNHRDLRRHLEAQGHRYKTSSDTETIVHAFEEWGPDCVNHLRGMFAFVIWDARKRQLFAARDRLGVKPFYYASTGETLICASEIKAILASGWHTAKMNASALPEHVTFGYIAGEATLFSGVQKLLPGHWLTWQDGVTNTHQYWNVPLPSDSDSVKSEESLIDEFTSLFDESVRMRLMSDVPLGVFLSGGLDSSAIAATMARQMSEPLKTFSVGFESSYYSEFDFAREVATHIGADHHEVVMRPKDLLASIPKLIWHEDEPIRNASSIALYEVARLAREHVKVVLTGEGSDELFAGYSRYWATLFNQRWGLWYERLVPRIVRDQCVRRTLWQWPLPMSMKRKISHTFLYHSLRPEEIVFDNFHAIFPRSIHEQLFTFDFYQNVCDVDPYQESVRLYRQRPARNKLDRLLYTDQKTYLVELLMKQDAMTMAASIESRVPFLDHELVEFAARVPHRMKLHREGEKFILKKSMEQRIPESILRRKKMGFPVPLTEWLSEGFGDVFHSILLSDQAKDRNVFNQAFVDQLLSEHVRGSRNHTDALWTIFGFEIWSRVFLDGESHSAVSNELMRPTAETATHARTSF
jgi:asparagine synthase (glutamine-hydrolysing)